MCIRDSRRRADPLHGPVMVSPPPGLFVDADGCPVKQEIYRVARRHGLRVTVVANSRMRVPPADDVTLVVVEGRFDAADDWIVEHVAAHDIVITSDISLIHISEPTRLLSISYAVFCLK